MADEALDRLRLVGDLVIAAWFGAEKDKDREKLRKEYLTHVEQARGPTKDAHELRCWLEIVRDLRSAAKPVVPFHWEIEFPEVFSRPSPATSNSQPPASPGFDAIVGNPPFAGKNTLISGNADGYLDWLKTLHEESHGNADLVAHFFRRAFNLLRAGGTFGLIATNTIGQGDTRSTGLRWICTHGGTIYSARKRYKWPGQAAVVVSIVHIANGTLRCPNVLDGRNVPIITAYDTELEKSAICERPGSATHSGGRRSVSFRRALPKPSNSWSPSSSPPLRGGQRRADTGAVIPLEIGALFKLGPSILVPRGGPQ